MGSTFESQASTYETNFRRFQTEFMEPLGIGSRWQKCYNYYALLGFLEGLANPPNEITSIGRIVPANLAES